MIDWTKSTLKETELASKIAKRAVKELGEDTDKTAHLVMDITATHTSGCKLKLQELLDAPLGDFLHDVCGIHKHLNRETGKLEDCFLPRYAANEPEEEELLKLTLLEVEILAHRLDVPDAIHESCDGYLSEDVLYVCELLMAGKYNEAMENANMLTPLVLVDCVEGSTYYGASKGNVTVDRLVEIGDAGKSLATKISVFLNLDTVPEFPLY